MWIKSQNNVLINLDQMESIYVKGTSVICSGHKYVPDIKNERILGTFETREDAHLVCRIIWEAIKAGEDTFYLPEKLNYDA